MIYTIEEIADKLLPVLSEYKVDSAYIFGSYVRGCADENSDVDIVIDVPKEARFDMFALSGLRLDSIDALGKDVDIISSRELEYAPESFAKSVRREGAKIYGKP